MTGVHLVRGNLDTETNVQREGTVKRPREKRPNPDNTLALDLKPCRTVKEYMSVV